MDEDLYEQNELQAEKAIAQRQLLLQAQKHFKVGYQSALVDRLEQREHHTALQIIKQLVQTNKESHKSKALAQAGPQLLRFLSSKSPQ